LASSFTATNKHDAVRGEFRHELIVAQRALLVFAIDDFLQLQPDGLP